MSTFNDDVISEFRSNRGHVSHGFGSSLVLVHSVGRRTGRTHVTPAMSLRDGDDWLVVGSAAGAKKDPAWLLNLRAQPEALIEVPALQTQGDDITTVPVMATELTGSDRAEAFDRFVQHSKGFAEYQERAGDRQLPVMRLSPRETSP